MEREEKGEGIKKYKLGQMSHGDVNCSLENTANNILTTTHGARWMCGLLGRPLSTLM